MKIDRANSYSGINFGNVYYNLWVSVGHDRDTHTRVCLNNTRLQGQRLICHIHSVRLYCQKRCGMFDKIRYRPGIYNISITKQGIPYSFRRADRAFAQRGIFSLSRK